MSFEQAEPQYPVRVVDKGARYWVQTRWAGEWASLMDYNNPTETSPGFFYGAGWESEEEAIRIAEELFRNMNYEMRGKVIWRNGAKV